MREIKKYVRFYLQQRNTWKNQSDDIPRNIVLMFNYDGKRLCTLTGIKVAKVDWDNKKQRVKLKVKRASEVNTYLNALEDKINNAYYKALSEGTALNNDYLMKVLNRSSKQEKPSFFDEWENYLTVRKHNLKRSSIEALSHSKDHFRRFAKGKRIEFEDIKPELVSDFAVYLRGIGHVDNTIHKHIKYKKEEEDKLSEENFIKVSNEMISFTLYPNPNNGRMTIECELRDEDGEFLLYDISGKTIRSVDLYKGGSTHEIDEKNLNSGIYFFKVRNRHRDLHVGKVIVVK